MRLEHEFGADSKLCDLGGRQAHSSAPFNRRDALNAGNRYALRATLLTAGMPGGAGRAERDTSGIRYAPQKAPLNSLFKSTDRNVLPVTACRVEINVSDSEQRTDVRSTRHWNAGVASHAYKPQFENFSNRHKTIRARFQACRIVSATRSASAAEASGVKTPVIASSKRHGLSRALTFAHATRH